MPHTRRRRSAVAKVPPLAGDCIVSQLRFALATFLRNASNASSSHPRFFLPYFNVSARFNPGGPGARGARKRLLQSSSHQNTMTKIIYDLRLLKGVSSSSFYPSSPGAKPRATPSNTHMLARIPFAWVNSLQFWLCTAKSTGMTDRRRRRQRPKVF